MIEVLSPIQWPDEDPCILIECAGEAFLKYLSTREESSASQGDNIANGVDKLSINDEDGDDTKEIIDNKSYHLDLYTVKDNLSDYTYYEILNIPMHAAQNQVRQAYHKSSLKYHPDKTGRGEKDAVFLSVKDAFDTLGDVDKRRAYDSSLDFDESIPSKDVDSDAEFYQLYGDCFNRNLRFASEQKKYPTPPSLGDDGISIDDVHEFYDYWTHFESWRDFSLVASQLLKHDTDLAGDRYEKRWMENEIRRKAKALKKEELSRITTLVERAMTIDPRLRRHREEEKNRKKQIAIDRKKKKEEAEQKKREEEEQRLKKIEQEKEELKKEKDRKKNLMRKTRQGFRRAMEVAFELETNKTWDDTYDMKADVDLLCEQYSYEELSALYKKLVPDEDQPIFVDILPIIRESAETNRSKKLVKVPITKNKAKPKQSTTKPWSKEELSSLSKGIKKYPVGASNRWGAIAKFVNSSISTSSRTKEECIAQYNRSTNAPNKPAKKSQMQNADNADPSTIWTEEQDKQLQLGLSKNPPTMDKNERWTNIAKGVTGKTKKQCVERFKIIRSAMKAKQDGGK